MDAASMQPRARKLAPTRRSTTSSSSVRRHSSSSNSASESPPVPAHRLADAAGKGQGLFATGAFRAGAPLFAEAPLLTAPGPGRRTNASLLAALSARTREEQRAFFLLANAHHGSRTVLPALGIFDTNALPVPCKDEPGRCGLFLAAARLNHACAPNVARTWDPAAGMMVFRALVAIAEGEELCVNYVDVLGTREQRREELREAFGFECMCQACMLQGAELEESDRRRATIGRLFDEVAKCANEPTLGLRKVKIALRLLHEEGLVHYQASFCFDAFQFCVLVSDFVHAKEWVRKAWEATCNTTGPESPAARTFRMYWANPRRHELAGTLPKTTLSGPES